MITLPGRGRTLPVGYPGITAATFVLALIIILGSSLLVLIVATSDKRGVGRGRELADQYCRACHSFNQEPDNGKHHINSADFSDEKLRERIKENPSGIFPKNKEDQDGIIKYLRSEERRGEEQKGRHN